LERNRGSDMYLGFFDVVASADHAMFHKNSEIIKPLPRKAFTRKIALFYPLVWEKRHNNALS
jgi:hypothetical protein